MSRSSFLPLALTFLAFAGAPGIHASGSAPEPRVSVHGTGEIRVAPDMAVLTVEATYSHKTPSEASAEVGKAMAEILRAARKTVRDTADLRTARIQLNPEYDWVDGKRRFRGYSASQTLEVTVRELARLEGLLEDLFKTPLTGLNGPDFRHSKADSLTRAAHALAVRDAALNAKTLCEAAERTCDQLVSLRMSGGGGGPVYPMAESRMMMADAKAGMPVQPGLLTFTATVTAEYRLE